MHCYDPHANSRFVKEWPYTIMYRPENKRIEDALLLGTAIATVEYLNARFRRLTGDLRSAYYVKHKLTDKPVKYKYIRGSHAFTH